MTQRFHSKVWTPQSSEQGLTQESVYDNVPNSTHHSSQKVPRSTPSVHGQIKMQQQNVVHPYDGMSFSFKKKET